MIGDTCRRQVRRWRLDEGYSTSQPRVLELTCWLIRNSHYKLCSFSLTQRKNPQCTTTAWKDSQRVRWSMWSCKDKTGISMTIRVSRWSLVQLPASLIFTLTVTPSLMHVQSRWLVVSDFIPLHHSQLFYSVLIKADGRLVYLSLQDGRHSALQRHHEPEAGAEADRGCSRYRSNTHHSH